MYINIYVYVSAYRYIMYIIYNGISDIILYNGISSSIVCVSKLNLFNLPCSVLQHFIYIHIYNYLNSNMCCIFNMFKNKNVVK